MRREPDFAASGYEVNRRIVGIQSDACWLRRSGSPSQNQPRSRYPSSQAPATKMTTGMRSC